MESTTQQPHDPGDDDIKLRQMIEALTEAVQNEDVDFVLAITSFQQLLRPFELVEYMDVVRRGSEDPVESRRWNDALYGYVGSLEGQEFPAEETDVIDTVMANLQFDSIVSSDETADESYDVLPEDEVSEDDNWEKTTFSYTMEQEEYERIQQLPTFKKALEYASGSRTGYSIRDAVKFIEENVSPELGENMLKILDSVIAQKAEQYANGRHTGYSIKDAKGLISRFGSSDASKALMESCLDKYVYDKAEQYANGLRTGYSTKDAKNHIIKYASTPGRRDAMLRRLGFI